MTRVLISFLSIFCLRHNLNANTTDNKSRHTWDIFVWLHFYTWKPLVICNQIALSVLSFRHTTSGQYHYRYLRATLSSFLETSVRPSSLLVKSRPHRCSLWSPRDPERPIQKQGVAQSPLFEHTWWSNTRGQYGSCLWPTLTLYEPAWYKISNR